VDYWIYAMLLKLTHAYGHCLYIQSVPGTKVNIFGGHSEYEHVSYTERFETELCYYTGTVNCTDEQRATSSHDLQSCIDVDGRIFKNVLY
jgi:hypothetical protein